MAYSKPYRIKTISDFHKLRGLPPPVHPLISVINYEEIKPGLSDHLLVVLDFYSVSVKKYPQTLKYGQKQYDSDKGVLFFMAPNQVFELDTVDEANLKGSGWSLLIHPDFLWNTNLIKNMHQYDFFNYSVHNALFISEKEEAIINAIVHSVQHEYHSDADAFSQNIIVSQIETLLNFSERFCQRQFAKAPTVHHSILGQLEIFLEEYFQSDEIVSKGLPGVQEIAKQLNISSGYLTKLLKKLTGQTTQQHIHNKLIEKAKEKLSTSNLSVSEIAYKLGFEQPQSFSKFFKAKTHQTPLEFREEFSRIF